MQGVPTTDEGLSPRVRGNQRSRNAPIIPGRSIPACAGEPGAGVLPQKLTKVYPRVCGGTISGNTIAVDNPGLSPRVRGNPLPPQLP